jgi:excisionase family DNA binding protein
MEFISTSEAADILELSSSTVRRLFDEGRIGGRKTPKGHRKLNRVDVEKLADELRSPKSYDDGITFD